MPKYAHIPWGATGCCLAVVGLLITLGTWQIRRLAWKEDLIAQTQNLKDGDYQPVSDPAALQAMPAGRAFLPIRLKGTFLHALALRVGTRTHQGQPGYHLFTPFQIDQGSYILVNRGWIPWKDTMPLEEPQGPVALQGFLRAPEKPGIFTPLNRPAEDLWHSIDMPAMGARFHERGLPVAIAPLYLIAQDTRAHMAPPLPLDMHHVLRNPHLGYAITWFLLAGAVVILYIFFLYQGSRDI